MSFSELQHPAAFILLTLIFGLEAQNVFIIIQLRNRISQLKESSDEKKAKRIDRANRIIAWLVPQIYLCSFVMLFLILHIFIKVTTPETAQVFGLPQTEILGCIDFTALVGFSFIWLLMLATALISYDFFKYICTLLCTNSKLEKT